MNDASDEALRTYLFGMTLLEAGKTDDAIRALVRAEKQGSGPATAALDGMVTPLPGEHPLSLEGRRTALRSFGSE